MRSLPLPPFPTVLVMPSLSQFSNEPEKCDKAKTASSSADLLRVWKLDSTQGVVKYVDQAEGYLRQYGAPKSTLAAAEDKPAAETEIPSGGDMKKPEESGEVGDYAKKAEELLVGTGEKSGAEVGDRNFNVVDFIFQALCVICHNLWNSILTEMTFNYSSILRLDGYYNCGELDV
ncbi:hypothetical protein SASPL_133203 [Salvia splendens]|uniref:Uncharacterized protein n=1 Tax=Salvia splendens TaxID=180675 RepID=A0A8X8ZI39_SALSN|nr:hypothetical protein SASPL_133203 [Salvia splendens]